MSLLARLSKTEDPTIAAHQFWASMIQYSRGRITEDQLKTQFQILPATVDETEWNWLKGKYVAATDKTRFLQAMHVLFLLAEVKMYNYHINSVMVDEINTLT